MRPLRLALALTTSALLLVAAALFPLQLPAANAQPPPPPTPKPSNCTGTLTSTVSADSIRICEPLTVTTRAAPVCNVCPGGIHVVYVQATIAPWCIGNWQAEVMVQSVRAMEEQAPGQVRAGVVAYNQAKANTVVDLTTDLGDVRGALANVDRCSIMLGKPPFKQAANLAIAMLKEARPKQGTGPMPCEFAVYMAFHSCVNCGNYDDMAAAGAAFQRANVPLIAACPQFSQPSGNGSDLCQGTKRMVDKRYYTELPDMEIGKMLVSLLDAQANAADGKLKSLTIDQLLPPNLTFVDGSASEAPQVLPRPNGTLLRWHWEPVQKTEPRSVTFRAQPIAEGQQAVTGTMRLEDIARRSRLLPMQPLTVTVAGLCLPDTPTPTATATETATPTATATDLPSATRTPSVTPVPTVTPRPTRAPQPVFLPLLLREVCTVDRRHMDVIVALDASTSMLERGTDGRTKLDAARAAAGTFLDALSLDTGDQAALVTFHSAATLLQPLTADRAALDQAFDRIQPASGTRIHLGIDAAHAELTSARHHTANAQVLVLLTDGRSNPDPVELAVQRAAAAKAVGITIFTIGLGNELDFDALARIASRPEYFYHAPDAADLARIYASIAVLTPCPGSASWGGR